MLFELTILGSNAAIPAHNRFPTAQMLNIQERLYLIDCGEGTQMRLAAHQFRQSKIQQIFISHLHGDHIFGLIGLLTTMNLLGRNRQMDVFAPAGLKEIIDLQLNTSQTAINFPLNFHVIDTTVHQLIFEDKRVQVYSIPLNHRIPTAGFLFVEQQRLRNLRPERLAEFDLHPNQMNALKAGNDVLLDNGQKLSSTEMTLSPYRPRSFAYCSDTLYHEAIIPIIAGVDLLFHEATFTMDKLDQAKLSFHSTAQQAAQIAAKAKVKQLVIGHFSSRYKDLSPVLKEAKHFFPATALGLENKSFAVELVRE